MDFAVKSGETLNICCNEKESDAVKIAAGNLITDLKKVLQDISISTYERYTKKDAPSIIIGTLGVSEDILPGIEIEKMKDGEGNLYKESFQIKVSEGNLYIAGADRRGTIYGIYSLCEWMGVSPWYFFADVSVKVREKLSISQDYCLTDWPSVEYRGIFINDEEELDDWVKNYIKEETIGVKTYEKIFELLLRLKANYIWPAMHVNSFNLLQENGALAEKMGIVVGTSHCDMLMRSNNREWIPWLEKKGYKDVVYDYSIEGRNREILKEYWRESVEQNQDFEVCYTLGMRGIHDTGFETRTIDGKSEEEARNEKVKLLGKIITDQREILKNTLKEMPMTTFIPYKEVLDLYDNGLEIPEDVTLVWANDNYGYIRRFPSEQEKRRKGGNGIYYHNSYWSPPSMSYVFLCSIPLAHTRNELQKAWDEGIRKLWILNSGAIKPLEQEITFFLKLAWEIGKEKTLTENVETFVETWINQTFTGNIGSKVSQLLNDFSQVTNVRKVENMDQEAFSQKAYGDEAAMRIHCFEKMFNEGNELYRALPKEEKSAFFQLVLMRIHAAYFTNLAYYYGDRSTLSYDRGNMQAAAFYSEKSKNADDARRKLLYYYNNILSDGKWNKILNPEGFPPPRTAMFPIYTPPLEISGEAGMRIDIWNDDKELCFTTNKEKWIDIGNTGTGEFKVRVEAPDWVKVSETELTVKTEQRVLISVKDTSKKRLGTIKIENLNTGEIKEILVRAEGINSSFEGKAFIEDDGMIALEADAAQSKDFKKIRRLGRMQGNVMEACIEHTLQENEKTSPLCYSFFNNSSGEFLLEIHRFPSLNSTGRIRVGISVDDYPIQVLKSDSNDEWRGNWKYNVLHNVERLHLKLPLLLAGEHKISVYAVDKYFAFSRIIIYTKGRKENELAGIVGEQQLPEDKNLPAWSNDFYGEISLAPRPVYYARTDWKADVLALTDEVVLPDCYGSKVEASYYLDRGKRIFKEEKGTVLIDAATVLAQSDYAWTEENALADTTESVWKHCGSESYGRSGLAMYIKSADKRWKADKAPSLNYCFECEGGEYTIWALAKFSVKEESIYTVKIDNNQILPENLYGNGCLWRYESEQIYRWVPLTTIELQQGRHKLSICSLVSGIRYDRFCLTKGKKLPPLDKEWQVV